MNESQRGNRYEAVMGIILAFITARLTPYFGLKAAAVAKYLVYVVVGFVILAVIAYAGFGIRSRIVKEKIRQRSAKVIAADNKVAEAHTKVEELTKELGPTADEVLDAKETAKAAEKERLDVIEKDSSTLDADKEKAFQRFCQLYPEDSKCR